MFRFVDNWVFVCNGETLWAVAAVLINMPQAARRRLGLHAALPLHIRGAIFILYITLFVFFYCWVL